MQGQVEARDAIARRSAFQPKVITAKPAIGVIGLGYVGAVTCGCLADLGHRIIGVDLDPLKRTPIAEGRSPIHEAGLDTLLSEAVSAELLQTTDDLTAAVRATDVTLVSVGTPTASDGGCDLTQIERVADAIGAALRAETSFHVVVLRCSVPPGTTVGVMAARIEAASGKMMGADFGVAFVPEFLREGMAISDFRDPPKTVIGASDDRTSATVARIFDPVDAAPILVGIETAELIKYVDNVWHATKVTFANEVGRLAKSMEIDGREVMDVFCRDTKLNLSSYYLKPGFAYGGSCLPKEVRAVSHLADNAQIDLPLIDSLEKSNAAQIDQALRLVRQTGARRVAVLGLAFKPGTDDIRESPILEVMADLMATGVKLRVHDTCVTADTQLEGQLRYVENGASGAARIARHLPDLLRPDVSEVLAEADAVIVTHDLPEYRAALATCTIPVIDVARALVRPDQRRGDAGIGW